MYTDLNITLKVGNVTTTSAVVDITLPHDFFPVNGSGIKLIIMLTQVEYLMPNTSFIDKQDNTYLYQVTELDAQTYYTIYPEVPVLHIGGMNENNGEQLPCSFPERSASFMTAQASGNECMNNL